MKRVTCYCCCGSFSWTMEFNSEEGGFEHFEGIADDCPKCAEQMKKKSQSDVSFQEAMKNVTPMRKRGRGR